MANIQILAKERYFPKGLADCPCPVCAACLYDKAHKQPWRIKGKCNCLIRKWKTDADDPDGVVLSTDSFVSSVPGLIPQNKDDLINAKFTAGTFFFIMIWACAMSTIKLTRPVSQTSRPKTHRSASSICMVNSRLPTTPTTVYFCLVSSRIAWSLASRQ